MRPIIALAGFIGCGKSTAAEYLVDEHGFRLIRFAGAMKDMGRALGLIDRELDGDLKEKPCDLLGGKTPRQFMQLLGTEFGRDMIDPHLWTRAWRKAVDAAPAGVGIVADDCRFPNEVAIVRATSPFSLVVRIKRGHGKVSTHISELQAFHADIEIQNDGSIGDLYAEIDRLVVRVGSNLQKGH